MYYENITYRKETIIYCIRSRNVLWTYQLLTNHDCYYDYYYYSAMKDLQSCRWKKQRRVPLPITITLFSITSIEVEIKRSCYYTPISRIHTHRRYPLQEVHSTLPKTGDIVLHVRLPLLAANKKKQICEVLKSMQSGISKMCIAYLHNENVIWWVRNPVIFLMLFNFCANNWIKSDRSSF